MAFRHLGDTGCILYHYTTISYRCFYLNWLLENQNLFFFYKIIPRLVGLIFLVTKVYREYYNICSSVIMILQKWALKSSVLLWIHNISTLYQQKLYIEGRNQDTDF